MNIQLAISTLTLGDSNTTDDNRRYATAVQTAIQTEYPEADVYVDLVANVTTGACWVSDDPTDEIKEHVALIANQVWDNGDY